MADFLPAGSKRHFAAELSWVWLYPLGVGSCTLPCPLPPGWWPWQRSQSFLAKSFSRNPSLSLALALGQERRQKGHLRRVHGMSTTPSRCSTAIVLFPQDPALPLRASICDSGLQTPTAWSSLGGQTLPHSRYLRFTECWWCGNSWDGSSR